MAEIPIPDNRPIAMPAALDAARYDDGLRIQLVRAMWTHGDMFNDGELPTAAAQIGGYVYEIADRVARVVEQREQDIRKQIAKRLLLVSEVARGLRCPVCHGKPAVQPHITEKDPQYQCGGGHVWHRPLVIEDSSAHLEVLLSRVAESGELPPIPARTALERTDDHA